MNAWSFAHPAFLWALALLPLLWWRARASARAEPRWSGTVAIWRRAVPAAPATGGRSRRGVPWAVLVALGALALGVVALAKPVRNGPAAPPASWILVLDRSPSMHFSIEVSGKAPSRIERAVERAVRLCEEAGVAPEDREWRSYDFDGARSVRGALPPRAWLELPAAGDSDVPWTSLDRRDHVWVSDCEPALPPQSAGVVHSGAVPSPGAIADLGESFLDWDGTGVTERAWASTKRGFALGPGLPADVESLARLWAAERRLPEAVEGTPACLRISALESAAAPLEGELLGDGWRVPARTARLAESAGWASWGSFEATTGERFPAVQWRPGEVRTGLVGLDGARADAALFAVAWVELFDRAALAQPSVASLLERQASGPEAARAPTGRPAPASVQGSDLAPWLGLGSALAALAALWISRGTARARAKVGREGVRSRLAPG